MISQFDGQIPTLSVDSLSDSDVDRLMKIGFCYAYLPDEKLSAIRTCIQVARDFFNQTTEAKEKWHLKEQLNPTDRYEGYVFRTQSENVNRIEQLFFEPDAPFGPYLPHSSLVHTINTTYMQTLIRPLAKAIFDRLKLTAANYNDMAEQPYCSLVFQLFTALTESTNVIRLSAHKDFGIMTVLYIDEPGLEVNYQNTWLPISPKPGTVIVNLGNAMELMTGGQCHSALHRVINAPANRISAVYFVNPNYRQPVINYTNNSVIASTGELFFKEQFNQVYHVDH
jgi:isopenicillin N synthase-like dioxygenase